MSDIDQGQRAHAKLSASGSAIWLNCAGSVKAQEGYPESTNPAAEWGTTVHELAEECLVKNKTPDKYLGVEFNDMVIDWEMIDLCQEYIDYVHSVTQDYDEIHYEERLEFTDYVPDGFGTGDVVAFSDEAILICDLKTGHGKVDAVDNTQLRLYALGIYQTYGFMYNFKSVKMCIAQPRLNHFDEWEITIEDLLEFGEVIKERAKLAISENAPRTAGEKQCLWCKAKADCPEALRLEQEITMRDFEGFADEDEAIEKLSDEDKRKILDGKDFVLRFFDAIEKDVYSRLMDGKEFKGYKIVEGRGRRKWKPDALEQLEAEIGEAAYEKKPISVTQADKILGKQRVAELCDMSQGTPKLVHESAKGKPIGESLNEAFEGF